MPLSRNSMFAQQLITEQWLYIELMRNRNIVFCNSVAGSGKTTLAVAVAYEQVVQKKKKESGIYIFAPVEESKMGYRPGSQREKEQAYTGALRDALVKLNLDPAKAIRPDDPIQEKKMEWWIEATSHTFQRGTNLESKVVIIDEAQNFTKPELRKVLTRVHDSSLCIVIGHSEQCDLQDKNQSGFVPMMELFKKEERTGIAQLTVNHRGWIATLADQLK